MNRLKISLLLALIGANIHTQAQTSNDWVLFDQDDELSYYTKPPEKAEDGSLFAWNKIVSVSTKRSGFFYTMVFVKIDCAARKIGYLDTIIYGDKGNKLHEEHQDERIVKMTRVVPETAGENTVNYLCKVAQ